MTIARYIHTLRYLKARQVTGRLWFRAWRPRPDTRPAPPVRPLTRRWDVEAWRAPLMPASATFSFLGIDGTMRTAHDWDDLAKPRLWRYNLHYFDDLAAADAGVRETWHRELVSRWIRDNEPGRGTGWEPYPTSLRIVNWIKWALATRAGSRRLDPAALHSLAIQTRWLRRRCETHIGGNHLWANGKALLFAGVFFDGHEADAARRQGERIVEACLDDQFLSDGGHYERSPMYQAIVLEDVLDLLSLARLADGVVSSNLTDRLVELAPRMLRWLDVMTHPDGGSAFFNDAALGIGATSRDLHRYARQLGIEIDTRPMAPVEPLADSGYVRLQTARAVLICDVALVGPDHLPAHAHADTLSCELSVDGHRVLVNGGTSTYEAGAERQRQRGTSAHNTVVVNDSDSSEVWGAFRVARRARPRDVSWGLHENTPWLEGAHDGYGRATHRRRWTLHASRLMVEDALAGRWQTATAHWHFGPLCVPRMAADGRVALQVGATELEMVLTPPAAMRLGEETWHPRFGESHSSYGVRVDMSGPSLTTHVSWR